MQEFKESGQFSSVHAHNLRQQDSNDTGQNARSPI